MTAVNRQIAGDGDNPPLFARAGQNIAASAAIMEALLAPATLKEQRTREKMCQHLILAAQQ